MFWLVTRSGDEEALGLWIVCPNESGFLAQGESEFERKSEAVERARELNEGPVWVFARDIQNVPRSEQTPEIL